MEDETLQQMQSKRQWIKNSFFIEKPLMTSALQCLNKAIDLEVFQFDLSDGGKEKLIEISDQVKKEGSAASTGPSNENRKYTNRRNNTTLKSINNKFIEELKEQLGDIYSVRKNQNICFYECSYYEEGQHFAPHYDFRSESGQVRKRTILLYMQEPSSGGALRFPLLQHEIMPIQGLIVSWNNTLDCTHPDLLSLHESLIINSGKKSVMTFFQCE